MGELLGDGDQPFHRADKAPVFRRALASRIDLHPGDSTGILLGLIASSFPSVVFGSPLRSTIWKAVCVVFLSKTR